MAGSSSEGTLFEAGESSQRGSESTAVRASGVPAGQASEPVEPQAEIVRLEGLLAASALEGKAQREEATRLRSLLRDALRHFEDLALAGPAAGGAREPSHDQAVVRALEAEAGRAELQFQLDELMGHVAVAGGDDGRLGEPLDVAYARLSGTARGLLSALAETQDGRDVARARLLLLEQDFAALHAHNHTLERELAEAQEHVELQLVRARGLADQLERAAFSPEVEALRGELAGVRARSIETQRALEAAVVGLERSQSSATESLQAMRLARAEAARLGAEMDDRRSNISELNQKLAREIESNREVGSQLGQAAAENGMLRETLSHNQAETARLRVAADRGGAEQGHRLAELGSERERAQRDAAEQQGRARRLSDGLLDVRELLGGLSVSVGRAILGARLEPQSRASDAATQPGMPLEIEAIEGLEEQVALRDQRILALSAELARERGRISAAVRTLEMQHTGGDTAATTAAELKEILALLQRP
jgi:hypothetical protein